MHTQVYVQHTQARLRWLLRHGTSATTRAHRDSAAPPAAPAEHDHAAPALIPAVPPELLESSGTEPGQQEVLLAAAVRWLVAAAQGLRGLHAAALQEARRATGAYAVPREMMPQLSAELLVGSI